jgi:hypothetical protein
MHSLFPIVVTHLHVFVMCPVVTKNPSLSSVDSGYDACLFVQTGPRLLSPVSFSVYFALNQLTFRRRAAFKAGSALLHFSAPFSVKREYYVNRKRQGHEIHRI